LNGKHEKEAKDIHVGKSNSVENMSSGDAILSLQKT